MRPWGEIIARARGNVFLIKITINLPIGHIGRPVESAKRFRAFYWRTQSVLQCSYLMGIIGNHNDDGLPHSCCKQ